MIHGSIKKLPYLTLKQMLVKDLKKNMNCFNTEAHNSTLCKGIWARERKDNVPVWLQEAQEITEMLYRLWADIPNMNQEC
jgi:hypothetical protein